MSGWPKYLAEAVTEDGSPLSVSQLNGEDSDDSVIAETDDPNSIDLPHHIFLVPHEWVSFQSSSWPTLVHIRSVCPKLKSSFEFIPECSAHEARKHPRVEILDETSHQPKSYPHREEADVGDLAAKFVGQDPTCQHSDKVASKEDKLGMVANQIGNVCDSPNSPTWATH